MRRYLRRVYRRLNLFFGIVWRPATGPSRDEPPMSAWELWWVHGLDVRTAWDVACIIHD